MSKSKLLYEGLPGEMGSSYRRESMDKFGKKAVEQSEKVKNMLFRESFRVLQVGNYTRGGGLE